MQSQRFSYLLLCTKFPKEYADVTFEKELLLYCNVGYYYLYGEFRDMDVDMVFGAALLDGEWIIITLEICF